MDDAKPPYISTPYPKQPTSFYLYATLFTEYDKIGGRENETS